MDRRLLHHCEPEKALKENGRFSHSQNSTERISSPFSDCTFCGPKRLSFISASALLAFTCRGPPRALPLAPLPNYALATMFSRRRSVVARLARLKVRTLKISFLTLQSAICVRTAAESDAVTIALPISHPDALSPLEQTTKITKLRNKGIELATRLPLTQRINNEREQRGIM